MRQSKNVLITDLDNTLYDWVTMWHNAFSSMLEVLVEKSGVPQSTLEDQIREIFQRHGTSEYAFVLNEIPALRELHPNENISKQYDEAVVAYRVARREALELYPTVKESLQAIKDMGSLLVVYTESQEFYSTQRLKSLSLEGTVDYLYTPADVVPDYVNLDDVRSRPPEAYELRGTEHRPTPPGELKPNPRLLLQIIEELGADLEQCVYVGDSLMKDIKMAQDAGVSDVYAAYGAAQHTVAYELLRRVSHWNDEDVQREKFMHEMVSVIPTYILDKSFSELLDLFSFRQFQGRDA